MYQSGCILSQYYNLTLEKVYHLFRSSRGVTIMNMSYLTREFQCELIERANKRYVDVISAEEDSERYALSNNV